MPQPALPELPPLYHQLEAQAQQSRTPFPGGELVWRSWGAGPPLLLLHGMHGSWTHWLRNIGGLAQRHLVLVPDLPGQGDSDLGQLSGLDDYGAALLAGMDRLGIRGGFDVIGFSFGATVALHLPVAARSRVRRLILLGSAGLGPFNRVSRGLAPWRGIEDPLARAELHAGNLGIMMFADPASVEPGVVALQMRNAERTRVRRKEVAQTAQALARFTDWRPPVVDFLWGSEDMILQGTLEQTRQIIRGLVPAAGMQVIPGAGHWVQYEAADEVNRFLATI